MRKIAVIVLAVLMMSACSAAEKPGFKATDASITVNGKTLTPGMDYTDPLVKDWDEYGEIDSCAYIGKDRTYTYTDFIVFTYPDEGNDYILEIELGTDLATGKGIKVGSTLADIEAKYGTEYETKGLNVTYTSGQTQLIFNVVSDKVAKIRLKYVTD
jgi:hypothetical protein